MFHSLSHRQQGLLLTGGGALIISPDALLIKLIGLPDSEILLWRGLLTALGFILLMLARHGAGTLAAYRRCGGTGIGVALLFSFSTFGFVLGNQYTKGGNVLMILAGAPLIAALLSRLFLGERLPRRTWLAIWLCLLGTSLIVLDDTGAGSWIGNGFALLAATALAANFTLCRTRPGVDMSPMLTLSGLIVAAVAALFGLAGGGIALPPADSLLLLVLLCLVLLPLGFTLIQRGPLYLPAAEVGLLMLLEVVVGTLWVWWILGERPAPVALIGGALVLGTLLAKGLYERRLERRLRGRGAAQRGL
ncbi:DMT family transporter [Halomonas sp. MCCC 1A17488]|uniref:DMT family transporter n=1 Tax=Billgrantia sulfidoxydans TaxID=2733484 RepID=A0ABX7W6H9_9GAMM|nr:MULTISPECIES: DMT family transporter [Halomonas]MCE8018058.1 DMT family transporter [Halomonas sp. MCCC 1A17488]MCG3241391.1 DMT family transporter [Halomonas sp. MCCC 1A17488]QPP48646.1 DMT family transporter [Halomonas sp. SS10-MC5]QTP55988.1 DMT family transporter [Halomonas sulfidoxydans]